MAPVSQVRRSDSRISPSHLGISSPDTSRVSLAIHRATRRVSLATRRVSLDRNLSRVSLAIRSLARRDGARGSVLVADLLRWAGQIPAHRPHGRAPSAGEGAHGLGDELLRESRGQG